MKLFHVKPASVVESHSDARSPDARRASRTRPRPLRECLPLRDPTECLLDAYDCIARRAYEHFLELGSRPGGEIEDWLIAERELLLHFPVNVHEANGFVYALASVPGTTAAQLSVGVESSWLVILARHAAHARSASVSHTGAIKWSAGEDDRPAKSVCVLELPAEIDAVRSIAILADGLLGIRMPKLDSVH
jgi:HSP20 family molecular chaperone IbpA